MNNKVDCLSLATLGPIGYLKAPGTMATIAALPLVYCLRSYCSEFWYIACIMFALGFGLFVITKALPCFHGEQDPSAIVFDELIGCLVTFIGTTITWQTLLVGFCLFRFFDISKWFGISYFERIPGACGIIIDDVIAALFSVLILQLVTFFHRM